MKLLLIIEDYTNGLIRSYGQGTKEAPKPKTRPTDQYDYDNTFHDKKAKYDIIYNKNGTKIVKPYNWDAVRRFSKYCCLGREHHYNMYMRDPDSKFLLVLANNKKYLIYSHNLEGRKIEVFNVGNAPLGKIDQSTCSCKQSTYQKTLDELSFDKDIIQTIIKELK